MELILLGLMGIIKTLPRRTVIRLPSAGIVSDVKGSVTGRMLTGGL